MSQRNAAENLGDEPITRTRHKAGESGPPPERRRDIESAARHHLDEVARLSRLVSASAIACVADVVVQAARAERSLMTMGNGGSAATALHLTNDLVVASRRLVGHTHDGRIQACRPLRAQCLNGNTSAFSAMANDHGYEQVFVRQMEGLVEEGDVVLALSGSGRSANCVRAMRYARQHGAITVGLIGFDGGELAPLCDHVVHVPCDDHRLIEDVHLACAHAISRCVMEIAGSERG